MDNLYLRLRQLRTTLENSVDSFEHMLGVLPSVRRELLRCYYDLPQRQVLLCPRELQEEFYFAKHQLQQALAFPAPTAQAQYVDVEQALYVFEQVAGYSRELD